MEDLGKLLNATPVHILVLFFAVAENVDSRDCRRQEKLKDMVYAAVRATGKFEGQWMPGAAVLVAKERFKCPQVTGSIVRLSGHYWCVDVTSIKNHFNPEFSLRLAVVYNCPQMSAVADVSYGAEFMEQVRGEMSRSKVQVLMGSRLGKLVRLYKPQEAAVFFQAWRCPPGEPKRLPLPDLEAERWLPGEATRRRWGLDPTEATGFAFYPSCIVVFGPAEENRNRILKPFECSRQSVRKTCFTLISYEA